MSALADALRALMPFAQGPPNPYANPRLVAKDMAACRDVLRQFWPCQMCDGHGIIVDKTRGGGFRNPVCIACAGAGWTPASVEVAIAREEELALLDKAVIQAAEDVDRWGGPGHPLLKTLTPALEIRRERQSR